MQSGALEWQQARKACESAGQDLVSIPRDEPERGAVLLAESLRPEYYGTYSFWTGGSDRVTVEVSFL